jgi:two-component sensor histidine kinase/PAS domain-containing protein
VFDLPNGPLSGQPSFANVAEALSLGLPYRIWVGAERSAVRFLEVGAACLEMIGVASEAVLADAAVLLDLVLPEDRARLTAESVAVRDARRPLSIDVRMLRPGGEVRWRNIRAAPQPLPDGSCEWTGLVVDITEPKRLAGQLEAERRRLQVAIELTGMGVFEWKRGEPDSVRWSDHQYAIYGLPPGTPMTVENIIAMIHPDDLAGIETARGAVLEGPNGGDFEYEYRIVRPSGEVRWILQHQRIERDAEGASWVQGTTLDVTERRNAEEHSHLQMRELAHRARNSLAVLQAMVHQTARDAASIDELVRMLMERIEAMARSQALAAASEGRPLSLPVLVRQALDAFDITRFDFDPALEALTAPGDDVIGIALLLHELATNAVKYGALSEPAGRVRLSRGAEAASGVVLEWRELGGPPVQPPARRGFGMRLLGAVLQSSGGRVEPAFEPDGFRARIEMPALRLLSSESTMRSGGTA